MQGGNCEFSPQSKFLGRYILASLFSLPITPVSFFPPLHPAGRMAQREVILPKLHCIATFERMIIFVSMLSVNKTSSFCVWIENEVEAAFARKGWERERGFPHL